MLQMGEYSARQQLKLSAMEAEVRENQAVTAQVNQLQAEKRQLQDMSKRLTFSLTNAEQANLSEADAARVLEIQQQLGVTPRGSIKAQNVREVRLYKEQQATRLGIIFHQSTPEGVDISRGYDDRGWGRLHRCTIEPCRPRTHAHKPPLTAERVRADCGRGRSLRAVCAAADQL